MTARDMGERLACLKGVLAVTQPAVCLKPMLVPGEDVCEKELSCSSLGHVHAEKDFECVDLEAILACSALTVS